MSQENVLLEIDPDVIMVLDSPGVNPGVNGSCWFVLVRLILPDVIMALRSSPVLVLWSEGLSLVIEVPCLLRGGRSPWSCKSCGRS